jgi:hypothetical protein
MSYVDSVEASRDALQSQVDLLQEQILGEHKMFAAELGEENDFIGAIQLLKRRLQETEKAGEDIRRKNCNLLDRVKELETASKAALKALDEGYENGDLATTVLRKALEVPCPMTATCEVATTASTTSG